MTEKYIAPAFITLGQAGAFHCPYCGVFARQRFHQVSKGSNIVSAFGLSFCDHCSQYAIWLVEGGKLIYPLTSIAPKPLDDMPEDLKADYEEARQIINISPRGAAALLRLCVQKLMPHLGEKGKDINDDIANLVKKGLPVQLQQALDSLRVIGNNAVHPGQIDLKDDVETATALFELINVIVDSQISQPKRIAAVYSKIPQSTLDAIKKRDGTV